MGVKSFITLAPGVAGPGWIQDTRRAHQVDECSGRFQGEEASFRGSVGPL
jgi:hypothetical protein